MRRVQAIDFVKAHLASEQELPPTDLERFLSELTRIDPQDWHPHLVAAGGTYTPSSSPQIKRPAAS